MTFAGSIENGQIDTEYTPDPDHRQSAQEQWFRACDKRISALELQVHRMLNPEPISDEWLEAPEYLQGYTDGRASVTRTEGDYAHVPGAIWEDMIDELAAARSGRPVMDSDGVLLSHDAYDALEREAAIGRSVPWAVLTKVIWPQVAYADYVVLRTWITDHEPLEAACTAHDWDIKTEAAE